MGDAQAPGDPAALHPAQPVVGMSMTPGGLGYWLVAGDGGIFSFGNARYYGSTGNVRLHEPIVGMAATPTGRGYWLVASDGGIFAFGDARYYGSTGNVRLREPIIGMGTDPLTGGYWLVARDGGVFSFHAPFLGSTGGRSLVAPIVGVATAPKGEGYWLLGADGGIFTFGASHFYGSGAGKLTGGRQAVAVVSSPTGRGYDILTAIRSVRVGFAGDVHGEGRVAQFLSQGGDPLAGMRAVLGANDLNIVNLETAVGSGGQAQIKQYTFQSPSELLSRLRAAGVEVVNLANNHSLDFGASGLEQTIADAHAAGLQVVGAGMSSAQAYAPVILDTAGGTVAFLGFSQVVPAGWAATASQAGVASAYDLPAVVAAVRSARARADYVVVMIHAGIEQNPCPTPDQMSLISALVGAGADVVASSHTHVLEGLTRIGTTVVDYGLGNFVWYTGSGPSGLLSVGLSHNGPPSYQFTPDAIDGNGSPQPLFGSAAGAVLSDVDSLVPGAGRC